MGSKRCPSRSALVQTDLAAAKRAWIEAAPDAQERCRRGESYRFAYQDSEGRYFDFHSLRGQFISTMENAGVSLKTLQALARHARVETTLKHYARVQLADVRSALDALPSLPGTDGPEILRATGTHGPNLPLRLAHCLALKERFSETSVDSRRQLADENLQRQTAENPAISGVFAANHGASEQEAPPGFEPGMADLQSAAALTEVAKRKGLTDNSSLWLYTGCSERTDLPADLVRLVEAWAKLPDHVRRAILTLADGCQ